MKDEKWFDDLFGEILDKYYSCDPEKPCPNAIKILKKIYRQGRADQNEAALAVIGEFFHFDIYRTVKQNQNMMALCRKLKAAISAAGPEVGE